MDLHLQALGAEEDRYGESYKVRRMGNGILPSLTPREDCYKGSRCGGGDRKRICKAAFRIPINQR